MRLDADKPHDSQQAAYLGKACELAYLPADLGRSEFSKQLGLNSELISVDNTQVYVGNNQQQIVVAFRGSESFLTLDGFKDWLLTNARNFLVVPEGRMGTDFAAAGVGARFHSGFISALGEVWELLFNQVDQWVNQNERPVWITGHSLGGALALLCGWRMNRHFVPVHQICTFGAPMIGNEVTAKALYSALPDKIYRYVDVGDLVPRLPTISLFSNSFSHCEREILVGNVKQDSATEKLAACTAAAVEGEIDGAVAQSIWDELKKGMPSHMMGSYLGKLI